MRTIVALAALLILPARASASTYDCSVGKIAAKSKKAIWSAKIELKDSVADAKIFVLLKDGKGLLLADVIKDSPGDEGIRQTLHLYEGLTVVGLRKQAQSLDLNLGHVDTANTKDAAPIDADAWASPDTKMIAVTDARAGLSATCRLE